MRDDNFKKHIMETFDLTGRDFERLFEEFLGYFGSTVTEFVFTRHSELKLEGKKNDEIFPILRTEVSQWRFAAESLTERQIRRIIYG